eukprot:CAMPEP_0113520718 /NCGR_PEP_ID=MMETSP0014_2-20120614/44251_1 /TAXON_ID=2857 /ORGANISM="Nitzschia sp." /LENGTH=598 /DNA_ID=CAMNT_0000418619 /DNA_START=433 /DNA_END=2229 /DNA_ORIENTATION=- /assembly_acc=CAM_ASM_000159
MSHQDGQLPSSSDQISLAQSFLMQDHGQLYGQHQQQQHQQTVEEQGQYLQNFQQQQQPQQHGGGGGGIAGDTTNGTNTGLELMFPSGFFPPSNNSDGNTYLLSGGGDNNGNINNDGLSAPQLQQQQQGGMMNGRPDSGILKDALSMEQDSNDMLSQYRELFGPVAVGSATSADGGVGGSLPYHTGNHHSSSEQQQQQSNRLFLTAQVEPLSGKPLATSPRSGAKKQRVSHSESNKMRRPQQQGLQTTSSGPSTAMLQQQLSNAYMMNQQQQQNQPQQQGQEHQSLQNDQQHFMTSPAVPSDSLEPEPLDFSLPSTMLPPSVLMSMLPPETSSHQKKVPVKAGKTVVKPRKRKNTKYGVRNAESDDASEDVNPQQIFSSIMEAHGYDRDYRLKADDSGYDAVPSPLQLASFGTALVKAVHTSDSAMLGRLISTGLSCNPCNQFRDSILDLVCKRANEPIYFCLLEHGADLQVADAFGRNLLHHCCWASRFSRHIVESILDRDPIQIFMEDKHGQTPLEYVRADLAGEWIDFLEEVATKYWPAGGIPPQLNSPKERRPDGNLVDPPNALSVSLAALVSAGSITPEQVEAMDEETKKNFQS